MCSTAIGESPRRRAAVAREVQAPPDLAPWKISVRDGIITWEAQQTDYPSVGPDRPEYDPRGCPRGAAFSWYTYSPTRVRYPYARGVLLEMYREAKQRLGDPVLAWADVG